MSDIEVTNIETIVVANPWKPWIFVRVDTDQGISGYGEATAGDPEDILVAIEQASDAIVGESPFNTERLFTPIFPAGGNAAPHKATQVAALSAIDIALWDIKAKYFDAPLYNLLGGQIHGDELRTYANGWYTDVYEHDGRKPELFAEAAKNVVDQGYDAMKFDPFAHHWRRMDRKELNLSIDCVRAVREAVGPDVDLLIEGHKRFSVPMAIEVAQRLAEFNPTWFEEPTPQEVNALKKVADKSPVPIATGESMITHRAFPDLLHDTAVGINQADVIHTGGVTELKKVAAMSNAEHVDMAPHMASGWITLMASAHVDTSIPNFMIQECFVDFAFPEWADEIIKGDITVEDGKLHIPDRPGHGIEIDWDACKQYEYTEETKDDVNVIDLFAERWETRSLSGTPENRL